MTKYDEGGRGLGKYDISQKDEKIQKFIWKSMARRRRENFWAKNTLLHTFFLVQNPDSKIHTWYFDNLKYDVSSAKYDEIWRGGGGVKI